MDTRHAPEFGETLVSTARAAIGDTLRSVVWFTEEEFEVLYLRSDLYLDSPERAREVKGEFVESERAGFDEARRYNEWAAEDGVEPHIGTYEFTLRVFSEGFVARVIEGDEGVIFTTDGIEMGAFEEFAVAVRRMLADRRRG
jgi:hypothetical protein